MTDDALTRLARQNPMPEIMPALPIEPLLRRVELEAAAHAQRVGSGRMAAMRLRRALPAVVSVSAVIAVAAVLITAGSHHTPSPPAVGEPSSPSAPPPASVRALPCHEDIGTGPPERGMKVILGVVALPVAPQASRALQTASSGPPGSATRLFAKDGLLVRTATRFRLIVPARLRDRLSISWGNANEGHRGTTIAVNSCRGPRGAKWLAFAGGYFVRDPLCATLIVAAGGQRRQVRIGVGRACPGQLPPPQPTER